MCCDKLLKLSVVWWVLAKAVCCCAAFAKTAGDNETLENPVLSVDLDCPPMKKFVTRLTLAAVLVCSLVTLPAQRIAVVDITAVLEGLDTYTAAQDELDRVAEAWRQEIAQEYDKIKGMYNRYQAEQVLLSDEARREREEAIVAAETRVREMQKNRFGPDGELFSRRAELVQPIQDQVYAVMQKYADQKGYDLIFDKGTSAGLLFSKPSFDKTDEFKAAVLADK